MRDESQPKLDFTSWLIRLIPSFDMDNNITKNKHLKVTFEKTSNAQNTCFWEATAIPNELELRWG